MCSNPFESESILDHHQDSVNNVYTLIFSRHLNSGETLSTVSAVSTADAALTVENYVVNAAEFTFNGATVAIGHAVNFELEGGTKGNQKVQIEVTTSDSRTLVGIARIKVYA